MKAGDTFYVRDRSVDAHLWVVISDSGKSAEQVLIVNMTTYESSKENVCLLDAGDHPTGVRPRILADCLVGCRQVHADAPFP